MPSLKYISGLSHRDYRDWLCIPSAQTDVLTRGAFRQDYRLLWVLPLGFSLYRAFVINWGDSLGVLAHILITVNVLTALILAELYEEIFIDYLPTTAHFVLWGCSRKYRHSRWFPPALPPYAAACLCGYLDLPLAAVVVAVHYLVRKHKAD